MEANGEVERAVKTIKIPLKTAQDPSKALVNNRNTPLDGISLSPAEMLMGLKLKTSLLTKVNFLKTQGSQEIQHRFQQDREIFL